MCQVPCPLIFDQSFWAEKLAWLGCGTGPIKQSDLKNAATMGAVLKRALSKECKAAATRLRDAVRAESGVKTAVNLIEQEIAAHARQQQETETGENSQQDEVHIDSAEQDGACSSQDVGVVEVTHEADGVKTETAAELRTVKAMHLPNGIKVVTHSMRETLYFYEEIFQRNIYLRRGIELQEGAVIMDVGANVGLFTLHIARQLENCTVIPIEPALETFDVMQQNLRMHIHQGVTVHPVNTAIGSAEGKTRLVYYPHCPGNSTTRPDEKETQKACMPAKDVAELFSEPQELLCEVQTVSGLMRRFNLRRIDLLKIDVEGDELSVLGGIDAQDWDRVHQVAMEVHAVGRRLFQVRQLLSSHGFQVCVDEDEQLAQLGMDNHMIYASRPNAPKSKSIGTSSGCW